MEPLSVAIIGCGNIAATGHLPAYQQAAESDLCRVVGVADADRERAEALAEQYGVPAFATADELLAYAQGKQVLPVQPRVVVGGETARVLLPGEPGYDDVDPAA